MKRSTPMKRTPFRSKRTEGPSVQREPKPRALVPVPPAQRIGAVVGGTTTGRAVLKEVSAKPGKRTPTKLEADWMTRIVAWGCVACWIDGLPSRPVAVHHILRGGRRIGHLFTLPLCDPGHHQNGDAFNLVSRHPNKAQFEDLYRPELELLSIVRDEVGIERLSAESRAVDLLIRKADRSTSCE